jgi:hypothetical protein
MSQHIIFFTLLGMIVLGGIGSAIIKSATLFLVHDFESCVLAGNPIMESDPRKCQHGEHIFAEIILSTPLPEDRDTPPPLNACVPAGCSSELCVPADRAHEVITPCEWKPLYACYIQAVCELQANGTCGWTETETFRACMVQNDK